jgi:hypothetical protein
MRAIIRASLVVLLLTLFAQSANASLELCDEQLKNPGVTKGLYGLCVAYWSSGQNPAVLENYNKKKKAGDPVMPGTEEPVETLACPCWNTLAIEDIGIEGIPQNCIVNDFFVFSTITFVSADTFEALYAGPVDGIADRCIYRYENTVTGEDVNYAPSISAEEFAICETELLEIAALHFEDSAICDLP